MKVERLCSLTIQWMSLIILGLGLSSRFVVAAQPAAIDYVVTSFAVSYDGTLLAVAGRDPLHSNQTPRYSIDVIDLSNWQIITSIENLEYEPQHLSISYDNTMIAYQSPVSRADVFRINDGTFVRTIRAIAPLDRGDIMWSPTRNLAAVLVDSVSIHDPISGDSLETLTISDPIMGKMTGFAWSPSGDFIATTTFNFQTGIGRIQVWEINDDNSINQIIDFEADGGDYMDWSPDGSRLALNGGGQIILYDRTTWQTLPPIDLAGDIRIGDVAWSPDGTQIAARTDEGVVVVEVATGQMVRTTTPALTGSKIDWLPDGRVIYRGTSAQGVLIEGLTIAEIMSTTPAANAGIDQTVIDADGNGTEVVTLDASASSDSDGSIVSYEWREGGTLIASGVNPTVELAVGVHPLTLSVTDDDGASASDEVVITVLAPSATVVE
jgi:WD40 repeat protein